MQRSIGLRLTLWYTGVLAGTLVLLGAVAYVLLHYTLVREVDAALSSLRRRWPIRRWKRAADILRIRSTNCFDAISASLLWIPISSCSIPPVGDETVCPQRRRFLLSATALDNATRGLQTFETLEGLGPHPVRVLTRPIVVGGRIVNLVQVGFSLERVGKTQRHFFVVLAVMLPVGLLLAGGGGWIIARRSLRPVDRMTRAARRISAERLSERLEETGNGDELDRLARTLNETFERLDQAFVRIREFSADASHELQTPLTILRGEMEVALRSRRSVEEYERTLRSALEEIHRMSVLAEGLLFLARSDAGVVRIDRHPVDLNDLVEDVVDELAPMASERGVTVEVDNAPAVAVGDPTMLRQLLRNLVDNAIKYTPRGGLVHVRSRRDQAGVLLEVSDTGPGIAPGEQERIFQRFYRSESARSEKGGGTGLGLSIVRSIAEVHGGKVDLSSETGRGATFRVRLPAPSE